MDSPYTDSLDIILGMLIVFPVLLILLGIPTLILYKIWADKKRIYERKEQEMVKR